MPLILGSVKNIISTPQGLNALEDALKEQKNKDQNLDHFKEQAPSFLLTEGDKILSNVFGKTQKDITSLLSTVVNMKEESISAILKITTSFLINLIFTLKEKEKIEIKELDSLLNTFLGSTLKFDNSFIEVMLTKDSEGNIM